MEKVYGDNYLNSKFGSKFCCKAAKLIAVSVFCLIGAACAGSSGVGQYGWAANGHLRPGPSHAPELIGVFDKLSDCKDAADAWASRQVVGNPVHAQCLPVDRD